MNEDKFGRNEPISAGELLGDTAFMVVESGHCLYEPSKNSAIRCTVPYGTELRILHQEGEWVQVIAFGKKA